MNNEYKYLINLTEAYLNNESIALKSDIDYNLLISLASKHNLLGVIFCVINNAKNKSIVDSEIFSKLQQSFYDLVYLVNLQQETANTAKCALKKAGIRFVCFKGIDIKKYYPVPESRMMGDIDILIDECNKPAAKQALISSGFKVKNENGPVWDFTKNSILLELHGNLLNETIDKNNTIAYFSNGINKAVFNEYEGEFENTFQFEYLIAHIAHHCRFYGAGIKMVLDLAIMLKYAAVDLNKAVADMNAAGLGRFTEEILSVCFKWYKIGCQTIKNTAATEEFLVSFGAFGFSNRNKSAVVARKNLEQGKSTSPLLMRLRLIFPSYGRLRHLPYIKFINGKPYLTPVAWIYRIFYNLKNKGSFAVDTTLGLSNKDTVPAAEAELNYFKEIGLI